MIDLDRRYGPFPGRVWGLILDLAGNTLALYGLVGYLRDGTHLVPMVAGLAVTIGCVLVLARPS
jgi:hypothetical protein